MEQIAQRTRVDGVVIGVLMGFAADGAPLVVYPGALTSQLEIGSQQTRQSLQPALRVVAGGAGARA